MDPVTWILVLHLAYAKAPLIVTQDDDGHSFVTKQECENYAWKKEYYVPVPPAGHEWPLAGDHTCTQVGRQPMAMPPRMGAEAPEPVVDAMHGRMNRHKGEN